MKETLSISMQATANFCCLPQPTGLVALATNFISEQANPLPAWLCKSLAGGVLRRMNRFPGSFPAVATPQ
jgi:hypothetical protein